jgi:hypothetical protein
MVGFLIRHPLTRPIEVAGSSTSPSEFLTKIFYALVISPMCATCFFHPIPPDLITLTIFGEVYKI